MGVSDGGEVVVHAWACMCGACRWQPQRASPSPMTSPIVVDHDEAREL